MNRCRSAKSVCTLVEKDRHCRTCRVRWRTREWLVSHSSLFAEDVPSPPLSATLNCCSDERLYSPQWHHASGTLILQFCPAPFQRPPLSNRLDIENTLKWKMQFLIIPWLHFIHSFLSIQFYKIKNNNNKNYSNENCCFV